MLDSLKKSFNEMYELKYRYITYHFKGNKNAFEVIEFNYNKLYSDIHGMSGGIREEDYNTLRDQYGPCTMNVIVNTWYRILFEEILNLFYILQSFSILIWMLNGYYRSSIIICKSFRFNLFSLNDYDFNCC